MNMDNKNDLINIISRCNCTDTQSKWLFEMSNKGYECMESECESCIISETCLKVFSQYHITPECKHCFGDGINSGYDLKCNNRCDILKEYQGLIGGK